MNDECCGKGCGNNCVNPEAEVDFTIYGRPNCQPCAQVKRLLLTNGYTIHYKDVHQDQEAFNFLATQSIRGVPAVFKGDTFVGNYLDILDMIKDR